MRVIQIARFLLKGILKGILRKVARTYSFSIRD